MFLKFFLIFTIIPVIELAIFLKVGSILGFANTIILIILTALLGAYMVRREGMNVMYRFSENMRCGKLPTEELFDGAFILVAGTLLITPGILTDIIGFLLIFPATKHILKMYIRMYIKNKINPDVIDVDFKEM